MAAKKVLLLCGDYMEDYEVCSLSSPPAELVVFGS